MELAQQRPKFDRILERLKNDVASLRTGRVSPALIENLEVDYYGSKTALKAIAAIANPEPRQLVVQPWDKNALPLIEKAIQNSSLGLAPIADKDTIRVSIPPLTEERRKEMVKLLGRHLENARIQIRREREDALRDVDRREKAKEISEDEKFRHRNEIQKQVDEANKKIEELERVKEKEILSV